MHNSEKKWTVMGYVTKEMKWWGGDSRKGKYSQ